jgi:hypothetical protein
MRKFLLVAFICVFILNVNGQTSHFKHISKNPAGTKTPGFEFKETDGRKALKSIPANQTQSLKALSFEGVKGDRPVVIRNGSSPVYIEKRVNRLQMDLSHLSPGLYIMEIHTGSAISRHKLLKR